MTTADAPARPARGRPRKVDHDAVVDAALRVMRREGFGALTMRALAAELGIAHTSLYTYVEHIEQIEAEAIDRLVAGAALPDPTSPVPLGTQLLEHLAGTREAFLTHPDVMHPPVGSHAWTAFSEVSARWRDALAPYGDTPAGADVAYVALLSLVYVSAARERVYAADAAEVRGAAAGDPDAALRRSLADLAVTLFPRLTFAGGTR